MSECQSCFLFPAKGDTIVIDTSGGCIKGARPFNKSNLMPPHEKNPLISCIQQRKSAAPNVRLDVGPALYYYYYYYHYQRHCYYQPPLLLPAYYYYYYACVCFLRSRTQARTQGHKQTQT